MEILSKEELYKCLEKEETIINKKITINYIDLKSITTANFENCKFSSSQIWFTNSEKEENKVNVSFEKCEFNHLLISQIDNIGLISIINTTKAKEFKILSSKINSLIFQSNINIDYKIDFSYCHFFEMFYFLNNDFLQNGTLHLQQNEFEKLITFHNNTLNVINLLRQYFKDFVTFENKFIHNSYSTFIECQFKKVSFNNSNFSNLTLTNCDFLSTTLFQKCKNIESANLKFAACEFKGYVLFDNSNFNSFEIIHSFFERKVSFDSFETNNMKLHQVSFEKVAYFDDLNKSNKKAIENWDRKTLRAIKRELTNSHNQIDYLRFKAYELNAYKKEVDKNSLNWKDTFILYFNQESNNFGLDWTKGTIFIFQWSFFFYIIYIVSYSYFANDINCIPRIDDFLVNYLKFLNPFSFLKSPIEDAENYFLPFLFFILGKIFVSYGIYQTVQAFRKFGVNGG